MEYESGHDDDALDLSLDAPQAYCLFRSQAHFIEDVRNEQYIQTSFPCRFDPA